MIIDAISNGIVIDHITAGKAMYLYKVLAVSYTHLTLPTNREV